MAHVTVTIQGRPHRLECGDGDTDRIVELAAYLQTKIDALTLSGGIAAYDRLLLMAALIVTDELFEARAEQTGDPRGAGKALPPDSSDDAVLANAIDEVRREERSRPPRSARTVKATGKLGPSVALPPVAE